MARNWQIPQIARAEADITVWSSISTALKVAEHDQEELRSPIKASKNACHQVTLSGRTAWASRDGQGWSIGVPF
jgi:hypothetical protein